MNGTEKETAASNEQIQLEIRKCRKSVAYFVDTYCQIYDAAKGGWIPFALWSEQVRALETIHNHRLVVVLKARQVGLTWLCLCFALWLVLFHPAATVLLFSRRDDESVDLLKNRLRGMYNLLPSWLKVDFFHIDNDHEWHLSTGSRVLAFPTTGGDSYTASLVVVDEADLVPDLDRLLGAVKPTIDAGGKLILLSRVDKSKPGSAFKKIYAGGKQRLTGWMPIFIPWYARPDRDQAWYEAQKSDILHRTGSTDALAEQYPTNDLEALAGKTLDKRLAPEWLAQCFVEIQAVTNLPANAPSIPGLSIYKLPQQGRQYVLGADSAEGNPNSDDSALEVLDEVSGEEVASLAGKFQPSTFGSHINAIGSFFGNARVLAERNNHGFAVLLWLRDNSRLWRLAGHDGHEGWLTNSKGKSLLYDDTADAFRNRETVIHNVDTFNQLSSIDGSTLSAPQGDLDDRATAYALACEARKKRGPSQVVDVDYPLIWSPEVEPTVPALSYESDDGSTQVFKYRDLDITFHDDEWWQRT